MRRRSQDQALRLVGGTYGERWERDPGSGDHEHCSWSGDGQGAGEEEEEEEEEDEEKESRPSAAPGGGYVW